MKFLILGAGPAGLSFAAALKQKGETSFLVLEKERVAGGLCRSEMVDGSPLDTGGGHFLDVRRPKVNEFLFKFMPEGEWNKFSRDSRIDTGNGIISHPFEANIWQFPQEKQIAYLKSIALAPCNLGLPKPENFIDWIEWKLGKKIAEDYMIPYNQKMFGENLNRLGTYWLEKLPDVSFEESLLSCLNKKPYGTQPGHAQFYYPKKYGYGELWLRLAQNLGANIMYGLSVTKIDFDKTSVTMADGTELKAERIITTIPWTDVETTGLSDELRQSLSELKHTSVVVNYKPETQDTPAHWIYYPDLALDYHRILLRNNFCSGARGYWTETNSERFKDPGGISFRNEYAYPLNTRNKPFIMQKLLSFARTRKVFGLGRWGEWEHYNSDVTVLKAMELAEALS